MAIVLKFVDNGEFRRSRVGSLTWAAVIRAASAAFPELRRDGFELKYRDDEDDLCLLSSGTFEDFAQLNQQATSIRLEVLRKATRAPLPPPASLQAAHAGADAPMGDSEQPLWGCSGPVPGNLPCFVKDLLAQLRRAGALAGGDALAALFAHFAPTLLQLVQGERGAIDRAAAESPDLTRSLLQSVRKGLEPFPQLQEMQMALDRMLQAECLEGVGAVSEALLRVFTQLPFEQQRDIVSVALGGVLEQLLQLVPEETSTAAEGWVHHSLYCHACGASPILGPCFRCTACPGCNLCSSCYLQKDILHPLHVFRCAPPPSGKTGSRGQGHCFFGAGATPSEARARALGTDDGGSWKGRGRCPAKRWGKDGPEGWGASWGEGWDKGWGKGPGKCWAQGWGKGRGRDRETSDGMLPGSRGGSSSSESGAPGGPSAPGAGRRRAMKTAVRRMKRVCKTMKREARQRWKKAKRTWRKEKSQGSGARAVEAKARLKAAKEVWKKEKRRGKDFLERIQAVCLGTSSSAATAPPPEDRAEMGHSDDDAGSMVDVPWRELALNERFDDPPLLPYTPPERA